MILPRPGAIHRFIATRRLADGMSHDEPVDALILDAIDTETDEGVRILWQPMGDGYRPRIPALPAETRFRRMAYGDINWAGSVESTTGPGRPDRVAFGEEIGTYRPYDETRDGVPELRDEARQELTKLAAWRKRPTTLRTEIRRVSELLGELQQRRDDLIRRATRVPVATLAAESGLPEARICQIRDGGR
ncbi:hypothetical protein ABT346_18900 [Micromonospora peucetia]|uniref:hypothetical protein n=1 Tax=Micromonospora peucetia TaxID=47871 RepID=UPI00332012B6